MMTKNIFRLFAALLMTLGIFSAQAQTAVHPKAYYDAIKYQWTDASGVSHENAITDEATDPYQIIALLKKVYCDPNIPGPEYSAYDKNGNRERKVYYGAIDGGWDISADDVTPPYEDGYTILMVAVSDNVTTLSPNSYSATYFTQTSQLVNYISNNIKAVQLLADGLRIGEGEAAGTAFNISGEYDRFFMIGKGQAREKDADIVAYENRTGRICGERVPFKQMFEQFSPTDGTDGSQITDFYAKMVGGELYGVIHDCASVIDAEHYFSMAGKNAHQTRSLTGLNIFIPDYRLKYWEDTYQYNNGWTTHTYTVDGRTLNPYKSVNGTEFRDAPYLCANYGNYNPNIPPKVGIYTIDLEGVANPGSEEKTYDVVLTWESSLDEMSGGTVGQDYTLYLVLTDEDGNEVREEIITTTENSYTYQVPQNEHSYTLSYIVFGQPNDGEHDMFTAWSNQADVIIPGWSDFLTLTLNHHESDYVKTDELNYYRNFLNVHNEDAVNGLTPARVAEGENSFTLYRYDITDATLVPVATMKLSGTNNIRYNIEYTNQMTLASEPVNVTTSGNLNLTNNGTLDMSDILFVDQFTAGTALNEHPSRYYYVLKLDNADKSTNTVEVPVYKTNADLKGYYTEAEVLEDTAPELLAGVKNGSVEVNLLANPAIYYYTVERGNNALPNQEISHMQLRTDGTFMEMSNTLGQAGMIIDAGFNMFKDPMTLTGDAGDYMTYQTVIWTLGEDRVNNRPNHIDNVNSYGSQIMKTGVTDLDVTVNGTRSDGTYSNWRDENNEWCSIYNPVLTIDATLPSDASVEYEPYMVRVWRDCDQIRNSVIVENGHRANDWWSPRPVRELIVDEYTNETHIDLGSLAGNELAFGATNSAKISFVVRYYYKVADATRAIEAGAPLYYVVEEIIPWENIPTNVAEISVAQEGVSTFYNAQGIKSDKPFDGVNIVVTTYSDGSTKTTKVVR